MEMAALTGLRKVRGRGFYKDAVPTELESWKFKTRCKQVKFLGRHELHGLPRIRVNS